MRNNEERFGAKTPPAFTPVETEPTDKKQPVLQFVTPTELVDLPSKGKFYLEGHPLHNQECIEVRHMTAKDEDILTSKTLLQKGIVLDRLLESVIVDKELDIDSLLIGDKNAIIIATRICGYGAQYETKVQCPICTNFSQYEFDLNRSTSNRGGESEKYDVEKINEAEFRITLPVSKAKVSVRLLSSANEKELIAMASYKQKNKLQESNLTDQVRSFVVSVNGSGDPQVVDSFVENMTVKDSFYLRKAYEDITPNIDLTQQFICLKCSSETELEVPLTADFFWPK